MTRRCECGHAEHRHEDRIVPTLPGMTSRAYSACRQCACMEFKEATR